MAGGTRRRPTATLVRAAALGCGWLVGLTLLSGPVRGEGLSGYVEFSFGNRESRLEDKVTGLVTETEGHSFLQRYQLSWFDSILPNLDYRLGGLFERVASTTDDLLGETDSTLTRMRPYFKLNWRTSVHQAELSLDRREDRSKTDGFASVANIRDSFSTAFSWSPERMPTLNFRYLHTHTYDKRRETQDATQDGVQFTLDYTLIESLRVTTASSFRTDNDRIEGNEVTNQTHTARLTYSDTLWDRRMLINTDYNVNYRKSDSRFSGEGDVTVQRFPFTGLSLVEEILESGDIHEMTLGINGALIDDNVFVAAGLNLGLPPPGGDDRPRHVGLDFVDPVETNLLFVWVDRELPLDVASAFFWTIYTSEDNEEWTLHDNSVTVEFGAFENRFEIRFDDVSTRYVKAVTEPLSLTDPQASEFPAILITELRAFLTGAVEDLEIDESDTSHIFTADVRTRLFDGPNLFHELTYFMSKSGSNPTRFSLTNGLSLIQPLGKVYTLSARIRREVGEERRGTRTANVYSASLAAKPLPTLRQNLVFSGTDESEGELDSESNAVFLLNVLELYRGIDLNVSAGKTKQHETFRDEGRTTESMDYRAGLTLIPHRTTSISLSHRNRDGEVTRRGSGTSEQNTRSSEISVAYRPLRSLYLYGSYRVEEPADRDERTVSDYSFNWAPFPGGTLRLVFNYNEAYRSEDDAKLRTILPTLRWDINRRAYLDLAYRKVTVDGDLRDTDEETFSGSFRTSF